MIGRTALFRIWLPALALAAALTGRLGDRALAELALRAQLLATPLTPALGGATTQPAAGKDAFRLMARNAGTDTQDVFTKGNVIFNIEWSTSPGGNRALDGLGPLFNRESCFKCHVENGRGRPPDGPDDLLDTGLVRVSIPGTDRNGVPNPVPIYGDQIQDRAVPRVPRDATPQVSWHETTGQYADGTAYALRRPQVTLAELGYGPLPPDTMTSLRMSNPVIGVGLLEAVPEATLLALADPDDADGDGVSGRTNLVWDLPSKAMKIGRFGWKANAASLRNQNAAAALGDMGISSPLMPIDLCLPGQEACAENARKTRPAIRDNGGVDMSKEQFEQMLVFTQLIAVPQQRGGARREVKRGEKVFREIGCADCHMPTLITGTDNVRPELANQTIHPFTDLLLHDMGDGLADGRPDYAASGREWRTAPLWGIGLTETVNGHTFFLHDGRARNLAEAILWHGGEAERAKEKFRTLPKKARDDLLAFLNSL
ncbi:MAG: di-heme oxidoredictase family protein [Rhodospirillaceae bacterium]|nr:di-heme oxidoredictase family protein [Rhodospirillaceae bacterium]